MKTFKVVVIGDANAGKTALGITMYKKEFPHKYIPMSVNVNFDVTVDGRSCEIQIIDTAGCEDYWRLRPLEYPGTNAFLLCFDICNRESFKHIVTYWLPEVDHYEPDVPVVLVGNKRDLRDERKTDDYERLYSSSYWKEFVREEEGEELVKKHNLYTYVECSALRLSGLDEVITAVVQACKANDAKLKSLRKKDQRWIKGDNFRYRVNYWNRNNFYYEPVPPPQGPKDEVHIEPQASMFAKDLGKLFQESSYADVQFLFSNQKVDQTADDTMLLNTQPLLAHRVILCAASSVFCDILMNTAASCSTKYHQIFDEIALESISGNSTCNSQLAREFVCFTVSKFASHESFEKLLQFLYTGSLPEDFGSENENSFAEVQMLAQQLKIPLLTNICVNVLKQQELLNLSIESYHNQETGKKMKQYFMLKPTFSDVTFNVEGHTIYAHKNVLQTRCDVMVAMFGGAFRESKAGTEIPLPDVTTGPFQAVLEYIYTDHVIFDNIDPEDVLALADRYCLPRLVTLCELQISNHIQQRMNEGRDATNDVIHLVSWSKTFNASQLHKWCLHYLASHYDEFKGAKNFQLLEEEDKEYVFNHRWPTEQQKEAMKNYEEAKKEYDKRLRENVPLVAVAEKPRSSSKCDLM